MTADHREVEDTYDLDEASVLPDLSSLKGVTSVSTVEQQLVATYFDTADLALAEAGVVLRRRTGGEDAGWQLKLPMDGARLEIAVPLGRAVRTPPIALRRVVAGLVRDQVLAHVVTIRTDRRVHRLHDKRGEVLAEIADDRVSTEPATGHAHGLTPITWREAEVELLSDSPSLLGNASDLMARLGVRRSDNPSKLFRAVGDRLPPAKPVAVPQPTKKGPAAEVIQLRLLTQVGLLRQLDTWVRHDAPESVHDMRVAVRRLRHALASYRPFLDREQSEPLHDELGWLAALLGGPRDCEVLHQLLRTLADEQPEGLVRGPVRARIDRDFRQRFRSSRTELLSAMTSSRYFDLIDRLEAFAQAPPWTDAALEQARRVLPKRLDHDWKRLRARVRAAGADDDSELVENAADLHEVRKAAKRVRYAAEALVPVYGRDAERMVTAHERIQTVLGDHHDDAEAETALLELADAASAAGENAFTYGVLHARLELLCSDRAADFGSAWQRSVSARDRLRLG
jgi:CHAD domain-containing protein